MIWVVWHVKNSAGNYQLDKSDGFEMGIFLWKIQGIPII